jgi:hemolysin activation/secretion protein
VAQESGAPPATPAAAAPDAPAAAVAEAADSAPAAPQAHSRFHGSFEVDNQYSIGTEPLRATLALSYSNLFGPQDELAALYQLAPQDLKQVSVFVTSYTAHPLADGLQPAVYFVDANTNVPNAQTAGTLGKGQLFGLRVSHPLNGAGATSQSLTLAMEYKHFRNTLALDSNASPTTPISYVNLSLAYAGNWGGAQREAGVAFSANFGPRGGANAANAYLAGDFHARENYFYVRGEAAAVAVLTAGLRLYVRVAGQYAGKSLNVNEDYPAAGIDGVRGYLEAEVLGDRALKGTVQLQSPVWQHDTRSLADGFLYIDAAVADMLEALPGEPLRQRPRSWGLGVDLLPANKLTGSLVWARPLVSAAATRANDARLLFLVRGTF